MNDDTRNLIDELKGKDEDDIIRLLDKTDPGLEIAIENLERDFNMGSIVRTANAFGVRHVHIIGRRQWNKRGAMATDRYLHVHYYASADEFVTLLRKRGKEIICIDNVKGAQALDTSRFTKDTVLVFGSEASGVSAYLLSHGDKTVEIRQFGSTRSLNVAAAAAIAMYEWQRQHTS